MNLQTWNMRTRRILLASTVALAWLVSNPMMPASFSPDAHPLGAAFAKGGHGKGHGKDVSGHHRNDRHHRGKGIGRALLAHEIDKAQGRQVSLITESHNETALALYAANGFAEKARLAAVPLFEDSKRHEWVLLARNMT